MTAWDLYGGAGVFAAVLAEARRRDRTRSSPSTRRAAPSRSARTALADLGWVVGGHRLGAAGAGGAERAPDVAVLDPPRSGAGREVDRSAGRRRGAPGRSTSVVRQRHSRATSVCTAGTAMRCEELRVFDSFPLTHHVECVAVLSRLIPSCGPHPAHHTSGSLDFCHAAASTARQGLVVGDAARFRRSFARRPSAVSCCLVAAGAALVWSNSPWAHGVPHDVAVRVRARIAASAAVGIRVGSRRAAGDLLLRRRTRTQARVRRRRSA